MTPIQAASLPVALAGKDLIAQAQTGSGKTAAFALALLAKLNPRWFAVQAWCCAPRANWPTRWRLKSAAWRAPKNNIKVVTLCGGIALRGQRASLENGAHIVVGTPGRIMDHLERGYLTLEGLNTLVLDEADRMLDMGFFDDIAKVAKQCPPSGKPCCFRPPTPKALKNWPNNSCVNRTARRSGTAQDREPD
jgi:ATP-independent RNA helicase DbpA